MGSFMKYFQENRTILYKIFLLGSLLSLLSFKNIQPELPTVEDLGSFDDLGDIDDIKDSSMDAMILEEPEVSSTKTSKSKKHSKKEKEPKVKKAKKVESESKSKKHAKKPKKSKNDKTLEQIEKDKTLCDDLRREKAYNTNIIKQNQTKIDYLAVREKTLAPMITKLEKEIKAAKSKHKDLGKKRSEAVKSRRILCKERKKVLKTMRKSNQPKIEQELNAITLKISAKIEDRSRLSIEMGQAEREVNSKTQELADLKAEQKASKDESFRLKKEISKLQKCNDNIIVKVSDLECKIRENIPVNNPIEQ